MSAESDIEAFVREIAQLAADGAAAGAAGLEALDRLVPAALAGGNQSEIILQWLASVYNGSEAQPVRLDDVRRLDWTLQKDLLAVVLGCNQKGFSDTSIAETCKRFGGQSAVDRLHWYTTGKIYTEALERIVSYIKANPKDKSAQWFATALHSLSRGGASVDLSRLSLYDKELTRDFVCVLSGLHGDGRGFLFAEEIETVLQQLDYHP